MLALVPAFAVFGPRLLPPTTADAAPRADAETVTCTIAPLITIEPGVGLGEPADFSGTLHPGTAACLDKRTDPAKKVIAAVYRETSGVKGNGTCASFTLEKATIEVDWVLSGGARETGSVSVDKVALTTDGKFTSVATVTGGPLDGYTANVDPAAAVDVGVAAVEQCAEEKGATTVSAGLELSLAESA